MAKNGKRFKRAPRYSSKEKTINFVCPKKGDVYKAYAGKNKKAPAFAGVVTKVEGTDTQVKVFIEVVSSDTIKAGKTIELSYLLHKDAWQKIIQRDVTMPESHKKKKKCCSNELYKLIAA